MKTTTPKIPARSGFTLLLLCALITLGLYRLAPRVHAQTIAPQVLTVTNFPPVSWTGTNAQALAAQVAALTNADGSTIVAFNSLTNRPAVTVTIRIINDTNGVPQSITALIR